MCFFGSGEVFWWIRENLFFNCVHLGTFNAVHVNVAASWSILASPCFSWMASNNTLFKTSVEYTSRTSLYSIVHDMGSCLSFLVYFSDVWRIPHLPEFPSENQHILKAHYIQYCHVRILEFPRLDEMPSDTRYVLFMSLPFSVLYKIQILFDSYAMVFLSANLVLFFLGPFMETHSLPLRGQLVLGVGKKEKRRRFW